jgi:hypothetical protein
MAKLFAAFIFGVFIVCIFSYPHEDECESNFGTCMHESKCDFNAGQLVTPLSCEMISPEFQ